MLACLSQVLPGLSLERTIGTPWPKSHDVWRQLNLTPTKQRIKSHYSHEESKEWSRDEVSNISNNLIFWKKKTLFDLTLAETFRTLMPRWLLWSVNVELPFEKLMKVPSGRSFEGATHFEDIRSMLDAFLIIIILRLCTLSSFWSRRLLRKRNLWKTMLF